ncbi:unnamed protein product [Gadus morhua 'NCC']
MESQTQWSPPPRQPHPSAPAAADSPRRVCFIATGKTGAEVGRRKEPLVWSAAQYNHQTDGPPLRGGPGTRPTEAGELQEGRAAALRCEGQSSSMEVFTNLSLDLEPGGSVSQALERYLTRKQEQKLARGKYHWLGQQLRTITRSTTSPSEVGPVGPATRPTEAWQLQEDRAAALGWVERASGDLWSQGLSGSLLFRILTSLELIQSFTMMGFEIDDSLKTYNPDKESHRSERPFRAAAVCLGVLCVVLLTRIIIVAGHHNHAAVEQPTPSCDLFGPQVQLGTRCNLSDLRREQTRNKNVTKERDQLRITCTNLIQEQGQLQTSYKNLTEERDKLKTSNMQLIQERDQLQTSTNNLTQERDHLLTINKCLTKEGFQLKTSNNNLTQERDLLGTSNKYLNKEMNQLQTINNNLTQERDFLQTSNKNLSEEMYQLQTINNNLTQERDLLQTSNKNLTEEMYQLQTINNNLTQERDLLQTSNKNLTEAMYQLQTINNNVTLERDQLKELQRLSGGGCLAGWQPHGGSCYFLSAEKKSWMAIRKDCQDKEADLVIIHSEGEQNFINNFCWVRSVWIGLHDMESESEWKWVDGSPMNLSLWDPGEPNNDGNEDCAELMPESKTWNDLPCSLERHWVCKQQILLK